MVKEWIMSKDHELIGLYIGGNEKALDELIKRHQVKVFTFILNKVKDEDLANDIFQDVFVKIINTIKSGGYNEKGKFIQWAMRIAHNLVIDHFRRDKRFPMLRSNEDYDIFDWVGGTEVTIEQLSIKAQIEQDARKLLNYLPEEQKEVMLLRIEEDLGFKEIAERTGVSINTALGRMRYALINLRKIIAKNNMVLTE